MEMKDKEILQQFFTRKPNDRHWYCDMGCDVNNNANRFDSKEAALAHYEKHKEAVVQGRQRAAAIEAQQNAAMMVPQQPQQYSASAGVPQFGAGGAQYQPYQASVSQAGPYNLSGRGANVSGGPTATSGSAASNTSQGAGTSTSSYTSRVILIMNIPVTFTFSSVFVRVREFGNSELTMIEPTVAKVRFEQLNDAVRAKNTIEAEEGRHGIFVVYSNEYL